MAASKTGTFEGTISEVGAKKKDDGTPYIGIVVDIPAIKERPERRLRYETDKDQYVARIILRALGGDPEKPPLPQLQALIGKAVEVQTSTRVYEGREYVNLDRIKLLGDSATFTNPADEINAALGFDVADGAQRDGDDDQDNGWDAEEPATSEEAKTVSPEEIDDLLKDISS